MTGRIRARRDELAALKVTENGKPMPEAQWNIDDTAACFARWAGLAANGDATAVETVVLADARFARKAVRMRLTNDSRYGQAAVVMSDDEAGCDRVAAALRAGIVWINCSQPIFVEAPWGGTKQSGIGRELGRWGYDSYLETKQITR